ncbi:hypothetical protein AXF42_Ash016008 [Apostasia shenzhenica]|uniref:Uncharacterized protein n=1 Tax=Apostasia shenzhenica TaxID=1088818 RepID=A0A2I0AWP3_9ASPA|nr:hypothetical protein AXF42_Ash016008 [Apostasia shenzhenica]
MASVGRNLGLLSLGAAILLLCAHTATSKIPDHFIPLRSQNLEVKVCWIGYLLSKRFILNRYLRRPIALFAAVKPLTNGDLRYYAEFVGDSMHGQVIVGLFYDIPASNTRLVFQNAIRDSVRLWSFDLVEP